MKSRLRQKTHQINKSKTLKICLAFSPGGHCVEAIRLLPALGDNKIVYASPYAVTTKDFRNIYFLGDPSKDGIIRAFISDVAVALKIIFAERPDVVVTTGAQIVIPLCYLSKILVGAKIFFIETFARMNSPSFTGQVIYPIADVFLVQWKSLLAFYGEKAQYLGTVF